MVYNSYTKVCSSIREIIHLLMLIDYLLVQLDKPWYNYYLPLGVYHMFSNLSTFRENANNEESDQTDLLGGGVGREGGASDGSV